uniref:Uncharacterized protein n=1 Tax=viral metagenome TaxID=1070528 RepID=A0A2V0RJZ5_9ZZZZ
MSKTVTVVRSPDQQEKEQIAQPIELTQDEEYIKIQKAIAEITYSSEGDLQEGKSPMEGLFFEKLREHIDVNVGGERLYNSLVKVRRHVENSTPWLRDRIGDRDLALTFSKDLIPITDSGPGGRESTVHSAQMSTILELQTFGREKAREYAEKNLYFSDGEFGTYTESRGRQYLSRVSTHAGIKDEYKEYASKAITGLYTYPGASVVGRDKEYTEVTILVNHHDSTPAPHKLYVSGRKMELILRDLSNAYTVYNDTIGPSFPRSLTVGYNVVSGIISAESLHVNKRLRDYGTEVTPSALKEALESDGTLQISSGRAVVSEQEYVNEKIEVLNGWKGCRRLVCKVTAKVQARRLSSAPSVQRMPAVGEIEVGFIVVVMETQPQTAGGPIIGEVVFLITVIPNETMGMPYVVTTGVSQSPYGPPIAGINFPVVTIVPNAGDEISITQKMQQEVNDTITLGDGFVGISGVYREKDQVPNTMKGIEMHDVSLLPDDVKMILYQVMLKLIHIKTFRGVISHTGDTWDQIITAREGYVAPAAIEEFLAKNRIPMIGAGGSVWHPHYEHGNMRRYDVQDLLAYWAMSYLFNVTIRGMKGKIMHTMNYWRATTAALPPCVFPTRTIAWNISASLLMNALECGKRSGVKSTLTEKRGKMSNLHKDRVVGFAHTEFSNDPRSTIITAPLREDDPVKGRPYVCDTSGNLHAHELQIAECCVQLERSSRTVVVEWNPLETRNVDTEMFGAEIAKTLKRFGDIDHGEIVEEGKMIVEYARSTAAERCHASITKFADKIRLHTSNNQSGEMAIYTPRYMVVVSYYKGKATAYLHSGPRPSRIAPSFHDRKAVSRLEHTAQMVHYASIGRSGALGYIKGFIDNFDTIMENLLEGDE